jgi:uncharacterized protein YgiM (DUF1202 family)
MPNSLLAAARYAGALAGRLVVIAGSIMLLIEAPSSAKTTAVTTASSAAVLKRSVDIKPLPQLRAADLDISKSVRVNVVGKAEPQTVADPVAATTTSTAAPVQDFAVISVDAANLRSLASKSGERVGVVRGGESVTVLEAAQGWTRIVTEGGSTGWVASKFLQR